MMTIPEPLFPLFIFFLGLIFGSFSSVCIHRLPKGESILTPRSHCTNCQALIRAYHNIPLVSYLWLMGRCRSCGAAISWRYPLVELLTGLLYWSLFLQFGFSLTWLVYALLVTALIIASFIDLEHQIIPDVISLPGLALGLLLSGPLLPISFLDSLVGALVGGGIFYLIALLYRGGMGGGDIKLIAMIGSFIGLRMVLLTIFVAAFSGSLVGLILILFKGKGRKDAVPFGPFLSSGAILGLLWGEWLIRRYVQLSSFLFLQ